MNYQNLCYGCFREKPNDGYCPMCGYHNVRTEWPADSLPPGSILNGRYLSGKQLERRANQMIYLCFDMTLETKVLLHEYAPAGITRDPSDPCTIAHADPAAEYDFRAAAKDFIEHERALYKGGDLPGGVKLTDYFEENKTAYYVTEYREAAPSAEQASGSGPVTGNGPFAGSGPMSGNGPVTGNGPFTGGPAASAPWTAPASAADDNQTVPLGGAFAADPQQSSFGAGPSQQGSFGAGPSQQGSFGAGPSQQGSFGAGPSQQGSFGAGPAPQPQPYGSAPFSPAPKKHSKLPLIIGLAAAAAAVAIIVPISIHSAKKKVQSVAESMFASVDPLIEQSGWDNFSIPDFSVETPSEPESTPAESLPAEPSSAESAPAASGELLAYENSEYAYRVAYPDSVVMDDADSSYVTFDHEDISSLSISYDVYLGLPVYFCEDVLDNPERVLDYLYSESEADVYYISSDLSDDYLTSTIEFGFDTKNGGSYSGELIFKDSTRSPGCYSFCALYPTGDEEEKALIGSIIESFEITGEADHDYIMCGNRDYGCHAITVSTALKGGSQTEEQEGNFPLLHMYVTSDGSSQVSMQRLDGRDFRPSEFIAQIPSVLPDGFEAKGEPYELDKGLNHYVLQDFYQNSDGETHVATFAVCEPSTDCLIVLTAEEFNTTGDTGLTDDTVSVMNDCMMTAELLN